MSSMKRKTLRSKAFTLVELMGVIILLSIIALIALTVVNKNIKQSEDVLYSAQIESIKDGAKNWSADNISVLPLNTDKSIYLTLAQLKQGGYVEDNLKSPSNDKKCFPNDLEIEIKASLGGKYEYKVNTDNITYVSCDDENIDRTSPYIVLAKGDAINKNNEVVDYVEVDQNSTYTVPLAYAYDQNGALITDSSAFSAVVYYKDEGNDAYTYFGTYNSSNGSITIDNIDIKNYQRVYKIEYSVNYDNKVVKTVRNIILQDTTSPVITIKKTEDVILYYSDSGVQTINYIFSQADVNDNSSSTACVQGDSGECFYSVDGVEDINSYFNSDEFRAISQSDYATFSKLFPVIITATDASGNTSKKSQNIRFTLNEVKEPSIKLLDASSAVVYDTSDSSITFEDTWRSDDKFTVKVESGCAIDDSNSYYIYNGNTTYFNTLGLSSKFDISFDITLEEGQKDLEVYATCGSDVDTSLFTVTNVSIPTTTVKVDRSAPQCIIDVDGTYNSDTGWYTSKPTITYTLSDTNGVSGTFNNNGITSNIDSTTNYSQSFEVTSDGSYIYTLEGTDVAGRECSVSKEINVDSTAPVLSSTKSAHANYTYFTGNYMHIYKTNGSGAQLASVIVYDSQGIKLTSSDLNTATDAMTVRYKNSSSIYYCPTYDSSSSCTNQYKNLFNSSSNTAYNIYVNTWGSALVIRFNAVKQISFVYGVPYASSGSSTVLYVGPIYVGTYDSTAGVRCRLGCTTCGVSDCSFEYSNFAQLVTNNNCSTYTVSVADDQPVATKCNVTYGASGAGPSLSGAGATEASWAKFGSITPVSYTAYFEDELSGVLDGETKSCTTEDGTCSIEVCDNSNNCRTVTCSNGSCS